MAIQLRLGLEVIQSYKRLAYTPWHAMAELVDNSTQSYFNNRDRLDQVFSEKGENLTVSLVYDRRNGGMLRVADNAMGMNYEELDRALRVGQPPEIQSGRSKFGMGLKTAACWIGNTWTVRTKMLGEDVEHKLSVDVDTVASGDNDLRYTSSSNRPIEEHYTIIEITEHNREFRGRTLGKIQDFLRSMYRQDLRAGFLTLVWQGSPLVWDDSDYQLLKAPDGSEYRKKFAFDVNAKRVHGWVGILGRGSRAKAGFSTLVADRVIQGWPDAWRPESLYGQFQGSNDLVNQRLIGEIHLDEFQVSHTKNDVLWFGDEEDKIQDALRTWCGDYVEVARQYRRGTDVDGGPTEIETQTAIDELMKELTSPEMVDLISIEEVPPQEVVAKALEHLTNSVKSRDPSYQAHIGQITAAGYLYGDGSPNDPYMAVDSTSGNKVLVTINTRHPHWLQLVGSEGVLNYLRHCTYDAISEWQARHRASRLDPETIKLLKDKLLRLPMEIEMHQSADQGVTELSGDE